MLIICCFIHGAIINGLVPLRVLQMVAFFDRRKKNAKMETQAKRRWPIDFILIPKKEANKRCWKWHIYEIQTIGGSERNERKKNENINKTIKHTVQMNAGMENNETMLASFESREKETSVSKLTVENFSYFSLAQIPTLTRSFWCPLRVVSACVFVSNLAFTVFISILWSMRYAFVLSLSHAHAICPCSSFPCFGGMLFSERHKLSCIVGLKC